MTANRRPYEQKRTMRQGTGDECASDHEIQELSKTCQVESEGTAGKCDVLPREASLDATASGEESAEVIVGEERRPAKSPDGYSPKDRRNMRMS